MRKSLVSVSLLLLSFVSTLLASGANEMTKRDPHDEAIQAYNDGLRYRDRAWKAEKELSTTQDSARQKNLSEAIKKSYAAAARAQKSAIGFDPTLVQAYGELGYALRKGGDFTNALAAYDTALKLNPRYAEAIEYRAEAYLGLNRLEEARAAYLQLFNGGDQDRARQLGEAMEKWVTARKADAGDVKPETIEEMERWLSQRNEIAKQTSPAGTKGGWR